VLPSDACYVSTEVDQSSVDCAMGNVLRHQIESRIQVLKTEWVGRCCHWRYGGCMGVILLNTVLVNCVHGSRM